MPGYQDDDHAAHHKVWFEPPYPLVVAQDPEEKGVDVHIQFTTYPVHYEWQEWEVVSTEAKCG